MPVTMGGEAGGGEETAAMVGAQELTSQEVEARLAAIEQGEAEAQMRAALPSNLWRAAVTAATILSGAADARLKLHAAQVFDHLTNPRPQRVATVRHHVHQLRVRLAELKPGSPSGATPPGGSMFGVIHAGNATVEQLRQLAASLLSWRLGHHTLVHGEIATGWAAFEGGQQAAARAVEALGTTAAHGLHHVKHVTEPAIRHDYRTRIHHETLERIKHVTQEAEQRTQADVQLHRGILTETHTRHAADLAIEAQLAPLLTWFKNMGQHQSDKVNRLEKGLDSAIARNLLGKLFHLLADASVFAFLRQAVHDPVPTGRFVAGASSPVVGGMFDVLAAAIGGL